MCEGLCSSVEFLSVKGFVSNQMCYFLRFILVVLAKLTQISCDLRHNSPSILSSRRDECKLMLSL